MDKEYLYSEIQRVEALVFETPAYELEKLASYEQYLESLYDTLEAMDKDNEFNDQI